MSRRKKSHQSHGTSNRPRFWGKHAVSAALDNPDRKVLRAWATREVALMLMQGKTSIPQSFIITRDGRLLKRINGFHPQRTPPELKQALEDALVEG